MLVNESTRVINKIKSLIVKVGWLWMIYGSRCVMELYSIHKATCSPTRSSNSLSTDIQVILPVAFMSSEFIRWHTSICLNLNISHIFVILDSDFIDPLSRRTHKLERTSSISTKFRCLHTLTSIHINKE